MIYFRSKLLDGISLFFILYWATQLFNTDAYYISYLYICVMAIICLIWNNFFCEKPKEISRKVSLATIAAISFSTMVMLANYNLWESSHIDFLQIISIIIFFIGGYFTFFNIYYFIFNNLEILIWTTNTKKRLLPEQIFIISFLIIVIVDITILFFGFYPGILTPDSISQINQILTGEYSNHHPFYYTQIVRVFFVIGVKLFGNLNAAIATFCIFQIMFMAFCFAYSISTMERLQTPVILQIGSLVFYILMPYHILYSMTIWKDVMFGGCVLLLILSSFRCMKTIGNCKINYLIFIMAGLGIGLFRSNGFFAILLITFGFVAIFRMSHRKIFYSFIFIIIASFVLKYPVLEKLEVKQTDTIESLSIPAQQIARVIADGNTLTDSEFNVLSQIIDIEKVPENYVPYISDNIKNLVREKGNQKILENNKLEYLKLYIKLGIKYPVQYVCAWIDETRGYWNAGYEYWIWDTGIYDNSFGIYQSPMLEKFKYIFQLYLNSFTNIQMLKIFLCIGFGVWIDICMFLIAIYRKDKIGVFITLPVLSIVISLLIATPVFSEFRYVYALFCSLPIIIVSGVRPLIQEK